MSSSKRKLEDPNEPIAKKKKEEVEKSKDKKEKKEKKDKVEVTETKEVKRSEDEAYNTGPVLSKFRISPENVEALKARGIGYLFPIQEATFDLIYDGKDVVGRARTGTGKTLAFALPVVERLPKMTGRRAPRVLVLAPTRELAIQINNEFTTIGKHLKCVLIYGGVPYPQQKEELMAGCDVVIGTPGRVIDFMGSGTLKPSSLKHLILDEADVMLDKGFKENIEEILKMMDGIDRQTLLFSATIPDFIQMILHKYLKKDHVIVDLVKNEDVKTPKLIRHLVLKCDHKTRRNTLADVVRVYSGRGRAIVFTNTKAEANELAMGSSISSECQVLHGDIAQNQREITLRQFAEGKFKVLVATNVAARGLDIPECNLIVQCQPPQNWEDYIHRSGRTARAGKKGAVVTFYTPRDAGEIEMLEKRTGVTFSRIGTPQPEELIRAAAENAFEDLEKVSESMIPYFEKVAKQLIEEKGAEKALSLALAKICGYTQPFVQKSLLTSSEGYVTILMRQKGPIKIQSPMYVLNFIKEYAPHGDISKIREIKIFSEGAILDVPNEIYDILMKPLRSHHTSKFSFEKCNELPQEIQNVEAPRGSKPSRGFVSRGSFGGGRGVSRGSFGGYRK